MVPQTKNPIYLYHHASGDQKLIGIARFTLLAIFAITVSLVFLQPSKAQQNVPDPWYCVNSNAPAGGAVTACSQLYNPAIYQNWLVQSCTYAGISQPGNIPVGTSCWLTVTIVDQFGNKQVIQDYTYATNTSAYGCNYSALGPTAQGRCINLNFYLVAGDCPTCNREGNPIDIGAGAKLQTEIDYVAPGSGLLTLTRTYSSLHGGMWLSNFFAQMNPTANSASPSSPGGGIVSLPYITNATTATSGAAIACTSGWNDLKATLWGGALSGGVATYLGSDRCQVSINGQPVAVLSVVADSNAAFASLYGPEFVPQGDSSLPVPGLPPSLQEVVLPDGSTFLFQFVNGSWTEMFRRDVSLFSTSSGFVFVSPSNELFVFGSPARIVRLDGKGISIVGGALPSAVTDSFGRTLSFSYGQNLYKISDPSGQSISFSFGANGAFSSVTYPVPLGEATQAKRYNYLGNQLTEIIDENGATYATYTYDGAGRAASSQHSGGADSVAISYGSDGSTTVTGALGDSRIYQFGIVAGTRRVSSVTGSRCSTCADADEKTRSYDQYGNLTSFSDWNGNVSCFAYDTTRSLETARLEGLGSGSSCPTSITAYVPTGVQRITQSQWHPRWRIRTGEAAPLKRTYWVYNGQADPTNGGTIASCAPATALLPEGSPIAVLCKRVEQATTDVTGSAGFAATAAGSPRVWTFTYNSLGQVLTSTGPRGNLATSDPNYAADTTTYAYYSSTLGGSYTVGDLESVTNAAGQITQFPLYDANGRVLKAVDPNNTSTTYTYHPRGWLLTKTVTPPSGVGAQTTTYGYDLAGQLTSVTAPDGSEITYSYDPAHRLTGVSDSAGDSITYTLDAMGNRLTEQVKDPTGVLARNITRVFDQLSQLQQVTGALQ